MSELNVFERVSEKGERHFQYDFRLTMPDGTVYRERRKARGATSATAARQIGLRRLQEVLRNGPPKPAGPAPTRVPTFAEYGPEWLAAARAQRQRPSTLVAKETKLRCHVLPLIGDLRLDQVTAETFEKIKRERVLFGAGTVNNILDTVLSILRSAPARYKLEIPEFTRLPVQRKSRWYTPEELEQLLESARTFSPTVELFILLTGEGGLRVGEVCALRWIDVDPKAGEVHVRRNLYRGKEGPTKSGKERRLPMSARLEVALKAHRKRSQGPRVLAHEDGRDMNSDDVRHALERVAKYAGVPIHGPHALRHCFGSRLMLSGAGAHVVMELLGHSKLATTQVYVHATEAHCRAAIDRLRS